MDKADLAQVPSKDESGLEAVPQNDTTNAGTRPTFLGRAHQCVSGICELLVCPDDRSGSSRVSSYLSIHRHRKGASTMQITYRK